jgi:CubicO group peptidase (beta-lactamase class C family)
MLCCKTQTSGDEEISTSIEARIDSIAQDYLRNGSLAGFSIAVLQQGDTIYNKAFGYRELETKSLATKHTIFAMASITKLHTAVATMKLVEQGKLSLSQTLLEVMPDFPRPEQARQITIRHLLSHTSGLKDYAEYVDSLYKYENVAPTKQSYFDFLETQELLFTPGSTFSYCNTGFLLMSFIIEKAAGMPYEDFIEKTIAAPLGLQSLKHLNRQRPSDVSRYYQLVDTTFQRSEMDSVFYFKGDGGLSATALDLAHVPFGLSDGKIISQASLDEMQNPGVFPDGNRTGYGLGMRAGIFEGQRVWGHTGGHRNYFSTLVFFPDRQLSIAVLNNTDDAPADALLIEGDVAMAVLGLEPPNLASLEQESIDLNRYVGLYSNEREAYVTGYGTTIYRDPGDNHLYRRNTQNTSDGTRLYFLGDHTFAYEQFPMDRLVFNLDEDGSVVGFQDYYNGLFLVLRRKVR